MSEKIRKVHKLYEKPLSECSREQISEEEEYSEYDIATAFNRLPMEFTEEEFAQALSAAILDNTLASLLAKNMIEARWDETIGEVVFTAKDGKAS
jgi:hypothetical protein